MHAAACFIVAHCVNPSRAIEINQSNKSTRPVLHNRLLIFLILFLDFGFGFYTTTNKAQAIAFADTVPKEEW